MQTELTPTIAEMNKVVAKYMGWEVLGSYDKITHERKRIIRVNIYGYWEEYNSLDGDWNVLHYIWNKVREQPIQKDLLRVAASQFIYGTPLKTLIALYNCIIFINQLKENNANKSI